MKGAWASIFRSVSHMLAAVFNSRSAFQDQWRRYERLENRPHGISGRWIGEWRSDLSGHHGELKCVLTPVSSERWRAYFFARYSRLFRVGYVTDLKTKSADGHTQLEAEEDLGTLAGGGYRCEGEATATEFNCKYSCKYDRGVFLLKRLD